MAASPLSQFLSLFHPNEPNRRLAIYTCVLGGWALVQGLYGLMTGSLGACWKGMMSCRRSSAPPHTFAYPHPPTHPYAGLVSDAFNMSFHCVALSISLVGALYARRPPSWSYSYGWERVEVLSAFSNALFLIFVCLFIIAGAVARLFETSQLADPTHVRILEFGLVSLGINVCGFLALGPGLSPHDHLAKFRAAYTGVAGGSGAVVVRGPGRVEGGGASAPSLPPPRSASPTNTTALYLALASHGLSSVAVIISSLLIRGPGWLVADTLQSIACACLTLSLALPLFHSTTSILLQTTPPGLKSALDRCRREAHSVAGVLEVAEEHFWTQAPGCVVGTLVLRCRSDAAEQEVLERVRRVYGRCVNVLTVQLEKDLPLSAWVGGGAPAYSLPTTAEGGLLGASLTTPIKGGRPHAGNTAYIPSPDTLLGGVGSPVGVQLTPFVGGSYGVRDAGVHGGHGHSHAGGHGHSHGESEAAQPTTLAFHGGDAHPAADHGHAHGHSEPPAHPASHREEEEEEHHGHSHGHAHEEHHGHAHAEHHGHAHAEHGHAHAEHGHAHAEHGHAHGMVEVPPPLPELAEVPVEHGHGHTGAGQRRTIVVEKKQRAEGGDASGRSWASVATASADVEDAPEGKDA